MAEDMMWRSNRYASGLFSISFMNVPKRFSHCSVGSSKNNSWLVLFFSSHVFKSSVSAFFTHGASADF